MLVGALGDIVFEVTPETVKTLDNLTWTGKANWAIHERHGGDALTEHTGQGADEISFDIYLSAFLGVSPMKEIEKIWEYERAGAALPLVIGEHKYGRYRWGIQNHTAKGETFTAEGDMLTATVSLNLLEYLRD